MEAKASTGSHCVIKTMSHITWFCSASLYHRLPAFHHHWCLQSGSNFECTFLDLFFKKQNPNITMPWLHSANWPLHSMASMEWGWTNWRGKGGMRWGQGKVSMAWDTVSYTVGKRQGLYSLGQLQVAVYKLIFSLWKKVSLSHFSASPVQTPTARFLCDMKIGIYKKPCTI